MYSRIVCVYINVNICLKNLSLMMKNILMTLDFLRNQTIREHLK